MLKVLVWLVHAQPDIPRFLEGRYTHRSPVPPPSLPSSDNLSIV